MRLQKFFPNVASPSTIDSCVKLYIVTKENKFIKKMATSTDKNLHFLLYRNGRKHLFLFYKFRKPNLIKGIKLYNFLVRPTV